MPWVAAPGARGCDGGLGSATDWLIGKWQTRWWWPGGGLGRWPYSDWVTVTMDITDKTNPFESSQQSFKVCVGDTERLHNEELKVYLKAE